MYIHTDKTTLRVIRRLWGWGVRHVAASDHTSMSLNSLCNHIETASVSHRHRSNTTFHIDITYVSHQYHIGNNDITSVPQLYHTGITSISHVITSASHLYLIIDISSVSQTYHTGITSISHRHHIDITSV